MPKTQLAVLISGSGTNLQAIMDACRKGQIDGEVVCVGSDNQEAFGLERARKAEIPTFILPYKALTQLSKTSPGRLIFGVPHNFNIRDAIKKMGLDDTEANKRKLLIRATVESDLLNILEDHRVDALICAGFMRILSPYFLDYFQPDHQKPRVLNIHPALLPSFSGANGYQDAWNYGTKVYGPTVHFMNYGIDTGPIIGQTALGREENDDFETFKNRGLQAEYELYPKCIRLFTEQRLRIEPGPDGKQKIVRILKRKIFPAK